MVNNEASRFCRNNSQKGTHNRKNIMPLLAPDGSVVLNDDGTSGPGMEDGHRRAFERIVANNTTPKPRPQQSQEYELSIRRGTEIELHPNGSLKRYKY